MSWNWRVSTSFQMAASANELTPLLLQGELDILAVPANLGSVLYNKTRGGVKLLAVSTLGVLYMVEKGGAWPERPSTPPARAPPPSMP